MTRPVPTARLALALAVLLGPALLALGGLALLGQLAWEAALVAALAAGALAGALLARHLADLSRLRRAVESLDDETAPGAAAAGAGETLLCPGLEEAVARAVRARGQARRHREATLAGHEAVLGALPDPLLMISAERRIVRANPAAEELFEDSLPGRDLPSVVRNPELLSAVEAVLGGEPGRVVTFELPGRVARTLSARLARLGAPARDGTLAVLALHDLTAIKRAEQMRADFVANASHELRTPLASLLGFIETLRGPAREDTASHERFLGVMDEQARRMTRLVDDLLSLSRIELHEHSRPRGTVDLAAVLRGVARTLEPQARDKEMRVEFDLAELPGALGEPDELTQVFQNLVDNAIKYGRRGTPIRIAGRPVAEGGPGAGRLGRPGIAVSVTDQGEGIARAHIPRLTERFYRVDAARSRKLGGTGLGLAIVKHILNRHRGALEIESSPGEGSTFTVYLPAASHGPDEAQTTRGAVT